MNTQRRKATGRRVATLGALSAAGMVAGGADLAEAGIIVTNVNSGLGEDIGFGPGAIPSDSWNLPGGNTFNIFTATYASGASHSLKLSGGPYFLLRSQVYPTKFGSLFFAQPANAGQTFNTIGTSSWPVAYMHFVNTGGSNSGPGAFTDKYYAFIFSPDGGTSTWYGWIKGSLTDTSYGGLNYHIDSFAYDDTGAVIPMGAVPEPASAAMALLGGALVAGAAGLRRWKKSRAEAAA